MAVEGFVEQDFESYVAVQELPTLSSFVEYDKESYADVSVEQIPALIASFENDNYIVVLDQTPTVSAYVDASPTDAYTVVSEQRQGLVGATGQTGTTGATGTAGTNGTNGTNGIDGDKTYVHTQSSAASVWNVNHNLNKFPSVTVVDSGNSVVLGDIQYVDANNLNIFFSSAFGGKTWIN